MGHYLKYPEEIIIEFDETTYEQGKPPLTQRVKMRFSNFHEARKCYIQKYISGKSPKVINPNKENQDESPGVAEKVLPRQSSEDESSREGLISKGHSRTRKDGRTGK